MHWTTRRLTIVAIGLGLALSACGDDADSAAATSSAPQESPDATLRGMVPSSPAFVSGVALPDGDTDFDFVAADGGLLVVYFGYTSCPDVCPTTLADLRTALSALGTDAERIDLAMVTIDPERDTPEVLTGYVQSFVDGAHALSTTDPDALRAAADAFGADYRVETVEGDEPLVEHTGFLYVVDDAGQLLLRWPYGQSPDDMAHDLDMLLDDV